MTTNQERKGNVASLAHSSHAQSACLEGQTSTNELLMINVVHQSLFTRLVSLLIILLNCSWSGTTFLPQLQSACCPPSLDAGVYALTLLLRRVISFQSPCEALAASVRTCTYLSSYLAFSCRDLVSCSLISSSQYPSQRVQEAATNSLIYGYNDDLSCQY